VKGWQPENYGREYLGPVTLAKALSQSLNTVAVRLGIEVGPKAVVKTAHRLGIVSELAPNASIALGTSEVAPLELVTAYAPFANGGIGVQAQIIAKVKTSAGKLLYQRKGASNGRVIEQNHLAMMNAMMQETLLTGTARKADLPGWQAAGKTGTSQDWRDAWFIGYTSHLVTGVWLGNDDNSPTKKNSGGSLPVEIWSRFMRFAHQGAPPQPLPGGTWQGAVPQELNPARPVEAPFAEAPMTMNRAAPSPAPVEASGRSNGLVPPGLIPNVGEPARTRAAPPRERNFFDTLFGG
jgi:penicillin-binding protein 1A